MMLKPCRLELNNSGAWKLLGRFDAANEQAADDILTNAARLADALNDPECGRQSLVSLRVSTDEPHPDVLMRYDSRDLIGNMVPPKLQQAVTAANFNDFDEPAEVRLVA